MRVLITGHHGYIGSVVKDVLTGSGVEISGLDTDFFYGSIPESSHPKRIDIRDVQPEHLIGLDAIIHLAALSNDPLGELNPELTREINTSASIRLAQAAKEAGVERFLFSSSCSIYGSSGGDQWVNEDSPLIPLTSYAVSKVETEKELTRIADAHFCPVFLRNATAYGFSPSLRLDLVINNLTASAYTTGRILIMSDGTPWRPVIHVQDIAGVFYLLLQAPSDSVYCRAFNVGGNSENYQVRDLAAIVRDVTGCKIDYSPNGGPDPRSYRVDFSKLSRTIPEYTARWNARRGVVELLEAFEKLQLTYEDFQGRKFNRIKQLKYLLDFDYLDNHLRWKEA